MENKILEELEEKIAKVRYQLMLKGTELDFIKQNINTSNLEKNDTLTKEVQEFRLKLIELNEKIRKLKFAYYVAYEVRFKNIWTQQIEKEIYNETFLLNKDLQIDLPTENDWKLDNQDVSELLLDLLTLLKHKYDEVTLLKVKRI
jgi:hypothetical protein